MNYKKIYEDFIIDRRNLKIENQYTEVHHIIPRCLGGDDSANNLIVLSYDDHFFAHLILHKIYPNHIGLLYTINMMKNRDEKLTRKEYSWVKKCIKRLMPELVKDGWAKKFGFNNYVEQCHQVWDTYMYGYDTKECSKLFGISLANVRQSLKFYSRIYDKQEQLGIKDFGYKSKVSINTRKNISPEKEEYRLHKTKTANYANRRDISGENNPGKFWISKEKLQVTCPHCNLSKIDSSAFRRWHLENCKQRENYE